MKTYYLSLALLLSACQSTPHAGVPATPAPIQSAPAVAGPETAASLLVQLRIMIADNACSSDAQCHTVGVGARACGGPAAYLAYSTAGGAKVDTVAALAAKQARARAAQLTESGELGACTVPLDPGAACVANVCALRSRANDPR